MIVRVIAHTEFHGVPEALHPAENQHTRWEPAQKIKDAGQDQGTTAERLIECAGRTCYDSYGHGRPSDAYHKHIMAVDHGSVCEHAWLTFFLSGISRGCTHELVRHRVGVAISQRSTRYVDESGSDWAWHPLLEAYWQGERLRKAPNGELVEVPLSMLCKSTKRDCQKAYDRAVEELQEWLITRGADKMTARKQARGAARGILGNALSTEIVWSCNLRAMRTILGQRAKATADAEIRLLANRLYEEALPYWPTYLGSYQKRPCPDGIGFELFEAKP